MKRSYRILLGLLIIITFTHASCDEKQAVSDSGVKKASVTVQTDENGNTVEQVNYKKRVQRDNLPGSIKHLYIISAYSGEVLEYSTVAGKVTSGGKRLSPKSVNDGSSVGNDNGVYIAGTYHRTTEVPDEYGTYGDSSPYFYWFDAQDNYHQYYPSGGTYVHISDKPLRIRKANFSVTLETVTKSPKDTSSSF
jgi:hypothetical protein